MLLVATKHISKRLKKGAKVEATGSRARLLLALGFKLAPPPTESRTTRTSTRSLPTDSVA